MKKIYLFAAMAAMLASCSSDDLTVEKQSPQTQQNGEEQAVMFDAYTTRTTTRAGWVGEVSTENLKKTDAGELGKKGFGVFAYYTNSSTYDQQAIPNFMYNQQVLYDNAVGKNYFYYTPVKYWPNEFGTEAQSEDADKVSFFAYAPYIEVVPSTGKPTEEGMTPEETAAEFQKWGINSLTRNNATGDPMVKYIASFDQDKSVDLCWGVCDDPNWNIIQTGSVQTGLVKGLPWIDVERPADPAKLAAATGQKVKFTFKHATAQLYVDIDAFVDGIKAENEIAAETKVFVRSITFEGLATKGTLNLNNTEAGEINKAYWLDFNGTNDLVTGESITIYDGRKDGKEGTPSGIATNEKALGLNPNIIQTDEVTTGVTNEAKPLFRKYDKTSEKFVKADDKAPIHVIPTGDPLKVTITYDIETRDDKLSTYVSDLTHHGSSIENVITKDINFGGANNLESGKRYVVHLHLGMNSVKFDAEVTDWVETPASDVNLPKNVPAFPAVANYNSSGIANITLPALTTTYQYAVTGLNGGEEVNKAKSGSVSDLTDNPANASGVAIQKATLTANMTVNKNGLGRAIIAGKASGKGLKIAFTQEAHALELSATAEKTNAFITVAAGTGVTVDWAVDVDPSSSSRFKVEKNGTPLTYTASSPNSGEFSFDTSGTDKKITLGEASVPGDVYTITIQAGNAPAETVTVKVAE